MALFLSTALPKICSLRLPLALFLGLLVVRKWSVSLSFGVTAAVTAVAWLFDFFTPVQNTFSVVYINPAAKDDDAEAADKRIRHIDGCNLKEMMANSKSLDAHFEDRGLAPVECAIFEEQGKEWVLMARTAISAPVILDEQATDVQGAQAPARKKGRFNQFASRLAGVRLHGPAVVLPLDRTWKPVVLGRMDMLSGAAAARRKAEAPIHMVTTEVLLEVYAAADWSATSVLEHLAVAQDTLRKRCGAEGEAKTAFEDLPAEELD